MGDLLRSEPMALVQMYIQVEAAHETLNELGQLGCVEFKDLNAGVSVFQRTFVNEIKRCEEMERRRIVRGIIAAMLLMRLKLRFLQSVVDKADLEAQPQLRIDESYSDRDQDEVLQFSELEHRIEELEKEYQHQNSQIESMQRNLNELKEFRAVLESSAFYLDHRAGILGEEEEPAAAPDQRPLLGSGAGKLGFLTGVVERSKVNLFEKVLWRTLRGNVLFRHMEIPEPSQDIQTLTPVEKDTFVVFFQGEIARTKIKKIAESFGAVTYPVPDTAAATQQLLNQAKVRQSDLTVVLQRTLEHRARGLLALSQKLETWRQRVIREKAIFSTMNLFNYDIGRKCLIAEGWCPEKDIEAVQLALRRATTASGALVPSFLSVVNTKEEPPTYFRLNKYTAAFHGLVAAYGVPRYGEINPTVFTIITFPFLFAVMFGDAGHGIILTILALYFILREDSLSRSNSLGFFALPMYLFKSNWAFPPDGQPGFATEIDPDYTYPFGIDPAWREAKNSLAYSNSLKMKLSIVFGVVQMVTGIVISYFNAVHFRKPYDVYHQFIPQMTFMLSIFGYLVVCIFLKWMFYYENTSEAPSLLSVLIGMFMHPFSLPDDGHLYAGQIPIQVILLFLAFISVPWMLVAKPYLLRRDHLRRQFPDEGRGYLPLQAANPDRVEDRGPDEEANGRDADEEFDFGDVVVHQIIHTIEFVLGAISNTASYLRLWALSLAHSQLSEVFWSMTMALALQTGNAVAIFVAFAVWSGLTFGVLLNMESLSAFLHALRLHWVEFQNKFYAGDGKEFAPFSFERLSRTEED